MFAQRLIARGRSVCCRFERNFAAKTPLSVKEAVVGVKSAAKANFDETVEIVVNLG